MIIKKHISKTTSDDRVEVVLKNTSNNSVTIDYVKGRLLGSDFDIQEDFEIDCTPSTHIKNVNVFLIRDKTTGVFSNMIDEVVEDGVDQAFNWFAPNIPFALVYHFMSITIPTSGDSTLTVVGIEEYVEPVPVTVNAHRGPN